MDAVSEARLSLINPKLADKIRTLAGMLAQESVFLKITQGLRSWDQQQKLYDQGRALPGKIVTNCPGGWSWHNFGLAVDCLPETVEGQADWNAEHPQWKRMELLGASLGLSSGALFRSFPDAPHFQLTGRFPVSPDAEVRQLFKDGGMQAVWDEANL